MRTEPIEKSWSVMCKNQWNTIQLFRNNQKESALTKISKRHVKGKKAIAVDQTKNAFKLVTRPIEFDLGNYRYSKLVIQTALSSEPPINSSEL